MSELAGEEVKNKRTAEAVPLHSVLLDFEPEDLSDEVESVLWSIIDGPRPQRPATAGQRGPSGKVQK